MNYIPVILFPILKSEIIKTKNVVPQKFKSGDFQKETDVTL